MAKQFGESICAQGFQPNYKGAIEGRGRRGTDERNASTGFDDSAQVVPHSSIEKVDVVDDDNAHRCCGDGLDDGLYCRRCTGVATGSAEHCVASATRTFGSTIDPP